MNAPCGEDLELRITMLKHKRVKRAGDVHPFAAVSFKVFRGGRIQRGKHIGAELVKEVFLSADGQR